MVTFSWNGQIAVARVVANAYRTAEVRSSVQLLSDIRGLQLPADAAPKATADEARQRVAGPLTRTGTTPLRVARLMVLRTLGLTRSRALIWRKVSDSAHIAQGPAQRSEEHTSELQSRLHLVCRLL